MCENCFILRNYLVIEKGWMLPKITKYNILPTPKKEKKMNSGVLIQRFIQLPLRIRKDLFLIQAVSNILYTGSIFL